MIRLPTISTVITLFSFLVGLFFVFAIPPFQKPDEIVHYYKAVSLASGNVFCGKQNGVVVNPIRAYLQTFPDDMFALHIASGMDTKFASSLYRDILVKRDFDTRLVDEPSSCTLPFALYLVPAAAIALPIALYAHPLFIFFLGRLASFVVGFVLFRYALKVAPGVYKHVVLFMMALPTVLFQISSYNKDAIHIPLGVVTFAQFAALRTASRPVNIRSFAILFASLVFTIIARPTYAPLLLFLFFIPGAGKLVDRMKTKNVFVIVLLSIVTVTVVSAGVLFFRQYVAKASFLLSVTPYGFVNPALQIRYLQLFPLNMVSIIGRTLGESVGWYIETLIGITGWIGMTMPWWIDAAFIGWFFFLVHSVARDKTDRVGWGTLVAASVVSAGIFLGIAVGLYVFSTAVAAPRIEGIQGRYGLVFLPFGIWLLGRMLQRARPFLLPAMLLFVMVGIGIRVYERYYQYSAYRYQAILSSFVTTLSYAPTPIASPFEQKESVVPGKKIAGMAIYVPAQKNMPTHPYMLSLLDDQCDQVRAERVIDMSALPNEKFLWVPTAPFAATQATVCWRIAPFATTSLVTDKPLHLLRNRETNETVASVLYLY